MKTIYKVVTVFLISLFIISCSDDENPTTPVNLPENEGDSFLRVLHSSYDAPAVDIWVNDVRAIESLAYGESSGYANLPAGEYNIKVVPSGTTSPIVIEANLVLEDQSSYTVIATGKLEEISPVVITDDRSLISDKAKVRFLHSSPDAPAVDIKVEDGNGATLFESTAFRNSNNYIEVAPGSYNLAVTPAGSNKEVTIYGDVSLQGGMLYTVNAIGTLSADDEIAFKARTYVDNGDGKNFIDLISATSNIKVVHASPDAPGVDLYVNNTKVGSDLVFPKYTQYLNVNSGTLNIKVNAAGTESSVINGDIRFNAFKNYSIYAIDKVSNISPLVIEDNLVPPASGKAHVRFLHLSPDAPAVDITLTDGTVIFGNVSFKNYTQFLPLDQGSYDLQVRLAGTSTVVLELKDINLTSGNIYSVFAKGFVEGSGNKSLGAEIIVNNQLLNN